MTAAQWWVVVAVFAVAVALVVFPSRADMARLRRRRREQARLELGVEIARNIPRALTRDSALLQDLALAIAQALDELDIGRTAAPPAPVGLRSVVVAELPPYLDDLRAEADRGRVATHVVQDLNDGYRA